MLTISVKNFLTHRIFRRTETFVKRHLNNEVTESDDLDNQSVSRLFLWKWEFFSLSGVVGDLKV